MTPDTWSATMRPSGGGLIVHMGDYRGELQHRYASRCGAPLSCRPSTAIGGRHEWCGRNDVVAAGMYSGASHNYV